MAKAEQPPIPEAKAAQPVAALPAEQVPELYALVAMFGLIMSGLRSEKPMGRTEHDEWLADRSWSLARALSAKKPR